MASVEAAIIVPIGATRARLEAEFTMPVEGVTFRPSAMEVIVAGEDSFSR